MPPPALQETLKFSINGRSYTTTCTDVFDGGYGWYIDALFPRNIRFRLSPGKQFSVTGEHEKYVADFVSYPTNEHWKIRFLISRSASRPGT